MKYSDDYSEIFSLTRNIIRKNLQIYSHHITTCNEMGINVGRGTIIYAADYLTAYNELSSVQSFMSLKKIIQ